MYEYASLPSIQFGSALSSLVESSARTSAHCNVLDALRAAERTTSIHAAVVGTAASTSTSSSSSGGRSGVSKPRKVAAPSDPRSWEAMASFLFGPDWCAIQLPGDDDEPRLIGEYVQQLRAEGKFVPPSLGGAGVGGGGGGGKRA